ncbi:hypothetical protein H206_02795 [Candidatus Electrothrix aarhusensis]|jgi:hypothetical protein|uniref:Uncharacterized protein n=1 Tax=Candidatus Electrothrix aarhusensis TaxID=1859131 RepID=A0A444J1J3_9BACT|nr:hypothetical protein H206_02795 [Candidatus Electrothrix aarhusensis]
MEKTAEAGNPASYFQFAAERGNTGVNVEISPVKAAYKKMWQAEANEDITG